VVQAYSAMQMWLNQEENAGAKAQVEAAGGIRFVFDHVRYHDSAVRYLKRSFPWFQRMYTAPWSPDFNKPVEHGHNNLKHEFGVRVRAERKKLDLEVAKKLVREAADAKVTAASVARDVDSLPSMWQVIIAKETETVQAPDGKKYRGVWGNWPPKELR